MNSAARQNDTVADKFRGIIIPATIHIFGHDALRWEGWIVDRIDSLLAAVGFVAFVAGVMTWAF